MMFNIDIEYIYFIFTERDKEMDYKEMYLKMMRANEEAIRILVAAQRECEELYVNAPEPELIVLEPEKD